MRHQEPGWELLCMYDPAGRRGIWTRSRLDGYGIEICTGREGDDDYVIIRIGDVVTAEMLSVLLGMIDYGKSRNDQTKEDV
jgi:hypothetical protein